MVSKEDFKPYLVVKKSVCDEVKELLSSLRERPLVKAAKTGVVLAAYKYFKDHDSDYSAVSVFFAMSILMNTLF
jgi:hypothetical protein